MPCVTSTSWTAASGGLRRPPEGFEGFEGFEGGGGMVKTESFVFFINLHMYNNFLFLFR